MTTKTIEKIELPRSSMANNRTLTVVRYGEGANGKKAYLQAGLHADAPPGLLVMHRPSTNWTAWTQMAGSRAK